MLFYYHEIKYIYHLNGSVFLATAVQQSEKELARKIGQGEVVKLVCGALRFCFSVANKFSSKPEC